jgi:hypothetical protein
LDFFLTRKLTNVNIDKGLPNRLDDIQQTRLEFLINLDYQRGNAAQTQKHLVDHVTSSPILILPMMFQDPVREKSLFTLGQSETLAHTLFHDLDLIDFLQHKETTYMRLRNYLGIALTIQNSY